MPEDLATLGMIVDGSGARREIKLTREELIALANGGKLAEDAMKRAIPPSVVPPNVPPQINAVTEAILRMRRAAAQSQANAMASQLSILDPFQKAGDVAQKSTFHFDRMRSSLTQIAVSAAGIPGPIGRLASVLGQFAFGGAITVGVVAGAAAIALAWEKLTEKSRATKEAFQKQLDVLRELRKQEDMGITGAVGAGTTAARERLGLVLGQLQPMNQRITAAQAAGSWDVAGRMSQRRRELVREASELQALIATGERANTKIINDEAEKRAQEAKRRFDEKWAKLSEDAKRELDLQRALAEALAKQIADETELTDNLKRVTDTSGKDAHDAAEQQKTDLDQILEKLREQLRLMEQQTDEANRIRDLQNSIAGGIILGGISAVSGGGAIGGAISGAVSGAMSGAGPFGIAAGAMQGLIGGLMGLGDAGARAREEMRRLRLAFDEFTDSAKAQLGIITPLQYRLNQIQREFAAMRDQISPLIPVLEELAHGNRELMIQYGHSLGVTAEMIEMYFQLNRLQGETEAHIREEARLKVEAIQQDLEVRRLRALGRTEEAEAMELALKQQREYNDAVKAGADATTLAALAETQRVEKITIAMAKIQERIDSLSATIEGLQSFRNSLLLSAARSPTDQYTEAKRQYDEILGKAQAGDQGAAGRLPAAAQTFLEASRAVNASGAGFQSDFERVLTETQGLIEKFTDLKTIEELMLEELRAIRDNTTRVDLSGDIWTPPGGYVDLPGAGAQQIGAQVTLLQEGFKQTVAELRILNDRVEEQTIQTRRGFDGLRLHSLN